MPPQVYLVANNHTMPGKQGRELDLIQMDGSLLETFEVGIVGSSIWLVCIVC